MCAISRSVYYFDNIKFLFRSMAITKILDVSFEGSTFDHRPHRSTVWAARYLMKSEGYTLGMVHGVSSGTLYALALVLDIDMRSPPYYLLKDYAAEVVSNHLHNVLPDDCHILCSRHVTFYYHRLPKNYTSAATKVSVSNFGSKNDVIQAVLHSMCVPYVTSPPRSDTLYWYLDGLEINVPQRVGTTMLLSRATSVLCVLVPFIGLSEYMLTIDEKTLTYIIKCKMQQHLWSAHAPIELFKHPLYFRPLMWLSRFFLQVCTFGRPRSPSIEMSVRMVSFFLFFSRMCSLSYLFAPLKPLLQGLDKNVCFLDIENSSNSFPFIIGVRCVTGCWKLLDKI